MTILCLSDKQAEDQPKSPAAASNVDLIPLETPRPEAEKPVGGSTAVPQGIPSCHSALVVSNFCTRVLVLSCRVLLLIGSG